jgi:hypothetical protein
MSNNGNANFKFVKSNATANALSAGLAAAALGSTLDTTSLRLIDVNVNFANTAATNIVVIGEPVPAGSQVLLVSLDGGQAIATAAAQCTVGFSFGTVAVPAPTVANFAATMGGVTAPLAVAAPAVQTNTNMNGGWVVQPNMIATGVLASTAVQTADQLFTASNGAAARAPTPTGLGVVGAPVYPCLQVLVIPTANTAAVVNVKMVLAVSKF